MVHVWVSRTTEEDENHGKQSKQKNHDAAFKAKVALEALKGEKTIAQISRKVFMKSDEDFKKGRFKK